MEKLKFNKGAMPNTIPGSIDFGSVAQAVGEGGRIEVSSFTNIQKRRENGTLVRINVLLFNKNGEWVSANLSESLSDLFRNKQLTVTEILACNLIQTKSKTGEDILVITTPRGGAVKLDVTAENKETTINLSIDDLVAL